MKSSIWVTCFDLHYPHYDSATWNIILEFIRVNKSQIAGFIFGGDQFSNDSIAHHNSSKAMFWEKGAVRKEREAFYKTILNPLEAVLPKNAKKIYILGNHERFETDWVEKNPQFDGFEHWKQPEFIKHGWQVIPNGLSTKIGKLLVIHGDQWTGYSPAQLGKRAVESYASSVLQGHNHTLQVHTKVSPVDQKVKWAGYVSPCCSNINPTYMRNKPSAWVTGFTVVEVIDKSGTFNVFPLITTKGKAAYGGRVYGN